MTPLTDACFNFTHESFRHDAEQVIQRALDAGVRRMVVPGASLEDSRHAIDLVAQHPDILIACAGTHPHLARTWDDEARAQLAALVADPAVCAVGECGLDYNRNYSTPAQQKTAFSQQLDVAAECQLPIFMHQRDAHEDFLALLKPRRADIPHAVVHCFTGNETELRDYLDLDCHIGITGWICDERRGTHLKSLVQHIPLSRLLLETDAPWLAPRDMKPRPRRNEPAYLPHIAAVVAACMDIPVVDLAHATHANAAAVFQTAHR